MSSKKQKLSFVQCHICGSEWQEGKSFSVHYQACIRKMNSKKSSILPCASIPVLQSNHSKASKLEVIDSAKLKQSTEHQEKAALPHDNDINNSMYFESQNYTNFADEDVTESVYKNNRSSSDYTQEQLYLVKKEEDYLSDTHHSKHFWPEETLCQIDLMKKLKELDCPIKAYDGIMDWAINWSSSSKAIFESSSIGIRRKTLINKLSSRYHLNGLKPTTKTISVNVKNNQQHNIHVSCFDFKEQLFSLLRDEELMDPKNLSLDGQNPGVEPIFERDYISEINHGEWYKSVYNYYLTRYGKEKNRVICGIILSIDKTHTDVKGKLCLEPVKFSLSIFNTETRRKKYSAWRRLGYINDLDAYRISKIFENESSDYSNVNQSSGTDGDIVRENDINEETQTSNIDGGLNNVDDEYMQVS